MGTRNIDPREAQIRASVLKQAFLKLKIKAMEPFFKHVSQKLFFNRSGAVWADSPVVLAGGTQLLGQFLENTGVLEVTV